MPARTLWSVLPVVMTAVLAIAYLIAAAAIDPALLATALWWLPGALALLQAAVLLLRTRLPLVALAIVVALDLVVMVTTAAEIGTTAFGVMVAAYAAWRSLRGARRWAVLGTVAATELVVVAGAALFSDEIPGGWGLLFAAVRTILVVAVPVAVAEAVSNRERLIEVLRERAESAERDRERRAAEAVLRERTLMARELHDVAAHHLTGIVVSAQAASALLATEPERARGYLDTVQADARTTLANLRQTVGLLRSDAQGELAPVPSIAEIPALVADAAATGVDVTLVVAGESAELGPLAGIAAYRMVQESLANAARHAAGSAVRVAVENADAGLRLTVANGPSGSAPSTAGEGYGLLGMAERAELIGARLTSGPTPDGGWANILTIPRDGSPA